MKSVFIAALWPLLTMADQYLVKLDPEKPQSERIHFLNSQAAYEVVNKKQLIYLITRPLIESRSYAIQSLSESQVTQIVEKNVVYQSFGLPDDALLQQQWNLIGQQGSIGMTEAWDLTTGSSQVVVAITGTGIDYTIPDLRPNIWVNTRELEGQSGVDDDDNGLIDDIHGYNFVLDNGHPMDETGHGSHVAGIIGAKGNNGIGISGIAQTVRLMPVKFISRAGGTSAGAIKAIDYAVENGAHVINASWGGGGNSLLVKEAIQRAADAGVLFVAAAGNSSSNIDEAPIYPASYDVENIISVAAAQRDGSLTYFSNYGENSVEIAAPGDGILSTTSRGYEKLSGTSMAAPHVAGAAALALSLRPNLGLTSLKKKIVESSPPQDAIVGKVKYGFLNVPMLLHQVQEN